LQRTRIVVAARCPYQVIDELHRFKPFRTFFTVAQMDQDEQLLPLINQEAADGRWQLHFFQARKEQLLHQRFRLLGFGLPFDGLAGAAFDQRGAMLFLLHKLLQLGEFFHEDLFVVSVLFADRLHNFADLVVQFVLVRLFGFIPANACIGNGVDQLAGGVAGMAEEAFVAQGTRYAVESTEPEGVCHSASYRVGGDVPLPLGKLYTLGIDFRIGRAHADSLLPEVMPLSAAGRLRPQEVTTRVAAWADAPEAWLEDAIKLVVARDEVRPPA